MFGEFMVEQLVGVSDFYKIVILIIVIGVVVLRGEKLLFE